MQTTAPSLVTSTNFSCNSPRSAHANGRVIFSNHCQLRKVSLTVPTSTLKPLLFREPGLHDSRGRINPRIPLPRAVNRTTYDNYRWFPPPKTSSNWGTAPPALRRCPNMNQHNPGPAPSQRPPCRPPSLSSPLVTLAPMLEASRQ